MYCIVTVRRASERRQTSVLSSPAIWAPMTYRPTLIDNNIAHFLKLLYVHWRISVRNSTPFKWHVHVPRARWRPPPPPALIEPVNGGTSDRINEYNEIFTL